MAALEASLAAVKDPGAGGKSNGKQADADDDSKPKSKAKKSGSARQGRREEVTRAPLREHSRDVPRLRRADCSSPGLTRRRQGKGFTYLDADGEKVTEPEDLARISELGIPPAWKDVWICPDARGHLQATGIDAAGRKQYLYHPQWRTRRDSEKFDEMTRFARALPALREHVDADLTSTDELTRERVLACAVRLLDRGFFRIGSEQYTVQNESFGLATMRKEHVTLEPEHRGMVFDYIAKSGKRRIQGVVDPAAFEVVAALKRRRGGGDELLAYKNGPRVVRRALARHQRVPQGGHRRRLLGQGLPHLGATMLAAIALAVSGEVAGTTTGRKRAVVRAVKEVSHYLGNTPAVCRASYIDPRVIDAYNGGLIIRGVLEEIADTAEPGELPIHQPVVEQAVLDLLNEREASPALERVAA